MTDLHHENASTLAILERATAPIGIEPVAIEVSVTPF